MTNPLLTLQLSKTEATALKSLPIEQRISSLNLLRRYYASVFHPDVTGKSGSALAEINNALDTLRLNEAFLNSYNEFLNDSRSVDSNYISRLQEQLQFWKAKAEKVEPGQIDEAEKYGEQIRSLTTKYESTLQLLDRLEQASIKPLTQQLMELLQSRKKFIQLDIEYQNTVKLRHEKALHLLENLGRQWSPPPGALMVGELRGMLIKQTKRIYTVDAEFQLRSCFYKKKGELTAGELMGTLVGGLTSDDRKTLNISISRFELRHIKYEKILFAIRPYLSPGMYMVTRKSGLGLTIHVPVVSIGAGDAKGTTQ